MDGMFNLGMYGLVSPKERDDDLKKKTQIGIWIVLKKNLVCWKGILPVKMQPH